MNDALQPLSALLSHAERERDEALAHRQHMQQALESARTQAEQLVAYRRDYEQRWAQRFTEAGQVQLLHSYHGFVTRLTQAIEHQQRVVVQAERQLERALETLQQQELRVASVLKLVERRVAEIEKAGAQREQRSLDELASRAAWNRLAAATTRF
ncbi:flagellar export protein FliJ [Piscinibacter sp.]|uniref:flagellar export protein FliJ n=1 Tax=Piscinibacter sp. TaxID=1903157 RepID=UPI001B69D4B6|nr:flagellar export protein FliJ [Piscinibacter sp.]MBP5991058.1 flagellar export protein FliJ [Piscinibacter sp.]MBP6028150.1 flagellar export protein FliJ [Piscinibacter sp.]